MSDAIEEEVVEEEIVEEESEELAPDNPLDMSDEDFMNMGEPEPIAPVEDEPAEEEAVVEEEEEVEVEGDTADEDETTEEESTDKTEKEAVKEEDATTEEQSTEVDLDYKAEYEKLTAPFKADGKQVTINSVDEALKLMQMGANYNRKMHGLKPSMKLLKMLDNNDLLDEAKLSYLIDLEKKDPNAINKLLKDAKIDPLEIDLDTEADYQPKTYTVSDKEVELDEVLESIQNTPTYSDTVDMISNKWDDSSKKVLLDQPSIIAVINDHKSNGIYDQIDAVVTKKQMLGELVGLSNLDAYKQVGDELQAQGLLGPQSQAPAAQSPVAPRANVEDPKLKDRKRAASSTKHAPASNKAKAQFNPLAMTDEEFAKVSAPL